MRLKKLQEKVKEHQEKVGEKVPISHTLIIGHIGTIVWK